MHAHEMSDKHSRFVINSDTRTITTDDSSLKFIQYDHNSEIFTFECPRFIEGHDMTNCNSVRIQYINLDKKTRQSNYGIYEVQDVAVDATSSERIVFTWLISKNATMLIGSLSFIIKFSCIEEDGSISYCWHTDVFKDVSVVGGIDNETTYSEEYFDILSQWRDEILDEIHSTDREVMSSSDIDKLIQAVE